MLGSGGKEKNSQATKYNRPTDPPMRAVNCMAKQIRKQNQANTNKHITQTLQTIENNVSQRSRLSSDILRYDHAPAHYTAIWPWSSDTTCYNYNKLPHTPLHRLSHNLHDNSRLPIRNGLNANYQLSICRNPV